MHPTWLCLAALALGETTCNPPTVTNSDVPGPHGEHLLEIHCAQPSECTVFARKQCGGDFDIVTNNTVETGVVMQVNCQKAPTAPSGPAASSSDAGP
jgi:hypothetical protein